MCLAPINPADLLTVAGSYSIAMDLPARLGAEGVGIVTAVGVNSEFTVGDLAVPVSRGCWSQRIRLKEDAAVRVPLGLSLGQAATLRINPATARRLLAGAPLRPGDFVLQNAGGSTVGRCVAILARALDLRCCSVVRNEAGFISVPGEIVIQDGDNLPSRVAEATGGTQVRLALDCVAGAATGRLAACLAPGGTLTVFGHLSRQPCEIPSSLLTGRGLTVRGFSLRSAEAGSSPDDLAAFYGDLAFTLRDFHPLVAATYKLRDLHAALRHAAVPGQHGKVLLDLT
jgi:NADPH:quinone reductase-like Zn-dependent oxidoreductase